MNTLSLDTFLVALYTIIDDLYKPVMSDSEILTLSICVQWLHLPERKLIRYVKAHWQAYFQHLITQSQYNRRFHALANPMAYLVTLVSRQMQDYFKNNYEVLDTIAVPLMKRCRGKYHKLFPPEIASFGIGGSDQDWYYGIKLALAVNPNGVTTGFILAPASTSDRWLAEYLLCYRHNQRGQPARVEDLPPSHKAGYKHTGPTGLIWPKDGVGTASWVPYIVDQGFSGQWWEQHWQSAYGATLLIPPRYLKEEAKAVKFQLHSRRQVVETVNEHLTDELSLHPLEARSIRGLLARIAAKLLALNLGIWLNKLFKRPLFALATLFSW
jgi:hypothetical protein